MSRLFPVVFAVLLAFDLPAVRADIPPGPSPRKPDLPLPNPVPAPEPQQGAPAPPYRPSTGQPNPPKRTGPFRSCGSGTPLALAGVAVAWGVLWLGNRFAGRVSRGPKAERGG